MKNFWRILTLILFAVSSVSCNTAEEPQEKAPIKVLDGNVAL